MEKILTRHFWAINLVTLALIAYFLGVGSSELAAGAVAAVIPAPRNDVLPPPGAARAAIARTSVPSGDIILIRNIFDSSARGLEEEEAAEAPAVAGGPLPLVPCGGQARLMATMAATRSEAYSFATVDMGGTRTMVRIGDTFDNRTVSAITWRYLLLKGAADECYIDMFGDPNAPPPAPTVTAALAPEGPVNPMAGDISVDGDTERTVARSVVDQALANPTMFAQSVRVRPYKQDGKVVGFRLRRIDKGSPLELLGAQRGDIIHSVNGIPLTSVDQALSAYQGLRSDSRLIFNVTRKGQPVDLKINIK